MSSWAINRIEEESAASSVKCNNKKGPRKKEAPLKRETKKIIYNAYKYFQQQKTDINSVEYHTDAKVAKLVAMATGLRESTVRRIISEGNTVIKKTGVPSFCDPKPTRPRADLIKVNDYHLGYSIRKNIYQMYTVDKVLPSLRKLADALKQNDKMMACSPEVLQKILLKIGFYYKKADDNTCFLLERSDIIEKRFDYLINILKFRSKSKNIFFIGETKIDPIVYGDVGKGCGLNVIVAGNRNGLISDTLEIYESDENITTKIFHEWVEHKLKNQLPLNSVVVMGSESHHCVQTRTTPTIENLKHEIQEWLHERKIQFSPDMCKVELLKIIKSFPPQKNYKVHKILQGHTVLHTPPFHMYLNPMWLVMKDIKEDLLRECVLTFEEKFEAIKRLLSEYPADKFQKYDDIINNNEREYWSYDMKMDRVLDELMLSLRGTASGHDRSDSDDEAEDIDSLVSDEEIF